MPKANDRSTQRTRAVELLRHQGIMRLNELRAHGIHPPTLSRLVEGGEVTRTGRGLYELADTEVSLSHS
ncbi:type IV toxin-antitoxin system AbiEi family antitoxin domain-containing protein, partial [Stenotrophomonas maltophilia]